ncbi:hypothetical protein CUMW_077470 [Citrus unshiu]|nr:hypothetical protein CUMW_077470 [Citrus unshiu]
MAIAIELREVCPNPFRIIKLPNGLWKVRFWNDDIEATVTPKAGTAEFWIREICYHHRRRINKQELVVGLDTEWCLPSSENGHQKVAVLQLCVGRRCLVFQLCHNYGIPSALVEFLGDKRITFVGKEVAADATKLLQDYGLLVANPREITMSEWDREVLSEKQIQYAAIDGFVSCKLGVVLMKSVKQKQKRRIRKKINSDAPDQQDE